MRAAVIGGGAIGMKHLEALEAIDTLDACAVVELNLERGRALASRFQLPVYTGLEEMLEAEQPDIAVIALPHHLHTAVALRCIENGCHLMLEKPMANTVAECNGIIAAARRRGSMVMVGHTQHYLPENRAARQLIADTELGQLVMVNDVRHVPYFRDDRPDWFFERRMSGGGIIMNLGAHSIDKIQWLTGSRIVSVKAALSYLGNRGDVEGSGMLMLELDSGAAASIVQSGYAGAPRSETELIYTGGMIRVVAGDGVYLSRGGPYERVPAAELEPPLVLQFRELLDCLREGREPECSGKYSQSVIAVLESVYRSQGSGKEEPVWKA